MRIVDESATGQVLHEHELRFDAERVTVRAIIEHRVREEVERFNVAESTNIFNGLVQPTDTEADLNGYRFRARRRIDVEAQCKSALEAFEANGFFMLVDDRQVESLDEVIDAGPDTRVSFVKLVPLVGG